MRGPMVTYDRQVMIGWANVYDDEDKLVFVVPIADLPEIVDHGTGVAARISVSTHGVADKTLKRYFALEYGPDGTFIELPEPLPRP